MLHLFAQLQEEIILLRETMKSKDDDALNHHNDIQSYQERYEAIQEEGRKLYELYEVKCIRIKELTKKLASLKDVCEDLVRPGLVFFDSGDIKLMNHVSAFSGTRKYLVA